MPRPIRATIDNHALRHNLAQIRAIAPNARVWAVVKANAYGHGIERTFEGMRGADGFALLDLEEAQRVRALGWRGPILLLEGVFEPRDLELCSHLNLWHTVHCEEQIGMLAAHKTHVPHRVFLKMNSGMNRLGFSPQRYRAAWSRLNALPQVDEISLMTHFSDADGDRGIAASDGCFCGVYPGSARRTVGGQQRCCAAPSRRNRHCARAGRCAVAADWVRPGIAVYGSAPDYPEHSAVDWGLQPCMTLASKIIATQALTTGASVGYGSTFVAEGPLLDRCGRLRLRRRLPAQRAHRHAGSGQWCSHPNARSRQHGHDCGRSHAGGRRGPGK